MLCCAPLPSVSRGTSAVCVYSKPGHVRGVFLFVWCMYVLCVCCLPPALPPFLAHSLFLHSYTLAPYPPPTTTHTHTGI